MPKRIIKPRRKVPRLTAAQKDYFRRLDTSGGVFSLENAVKLYADVVPLRGNLTTDPERTPLGVMTPEQVVAYKKQRMEDVRQAVQEGIDDGDAGRFTSFDSAEALTEHLKSLARKALKLPGDAPTGGNIQGVVVPGVFYG